MVHTIQNKDGIWVNTVEQVRKAFLDYYKHLLGSKLSQRASVKEEIIAQGPVLTYVHQSILECNFSPTDVTKAMFSIPNDKTQGMDGYNSFFFKQTWDIVGAEVTDVVL